MALLALGACSSGPAQQSGLPSAAASLVEDYVGALNSRDAAAIQGMLGTGVITPANRATEASRRIEELGGRNLELSDVKITSQLGSLYSLNVSLTETNGTVHEEHEAVITDAEGLYKMGTKYVDQTAPGTPIERTAATTP